MSLKKIFSTELYQGEKKRANYFEGWYFKLVSADRKNALALIPGISKNETDSHAFIQVFLSTKGEAMTLKTDYIRFPANDFEFSKDQFLVRIGENVFTKDYVSVDLRTKDGPLSGTFRFQDHVPIRRSLIRPNIMGFFGYLGFMECYHGVISMSHETTGTLTYAQEKISFDRGKGYLEKDWGKSFPESYVWTQCNNFKDDRTSLMFSYARIPFLKRTFQGLIANLVLNGREYRFATYNGARILKEDVNKDSVYYLIKRGRYALEISAKTTVSAELKSPRNGRMVESIREGLSGNVEFQLWDKNGLIASDEGTNAGVEIMK
ncbi:MAG: tocopherol cyclase family protein [Acholeplasmataceae bacterium]